MKHTLTKEKISLHILLVKGWVEKEGKFLIAQRSLDELHMPGAWSLPGGKVGNDADEDVLIKTLKKEIKEETNIIIDDTMEFVYSSAFTRQDNVRVIGLTFLCRYKSGESLPLSETIELKWLTLEELSLFTPVEDFLKKEINALRHFVQHKNNVLTRLTSQINIFIDKHT